MHLAGMDADKPSAAKPQPKTWTFLFHRRDAETRRKAKKGGWHADELDGGGPSCRSVCGPTGVCPCKGAEGAEDAEEKGVSRNRRGARRFCTLAVQIKTNAKKKAFGQVYFAVGMRLAFAVAPKMCRLLALRNLSAMPA